MTHVLVEVEKSLNTAAVANKVRYNPRDGVKIVQNARNEGLCGKKPHNTLPEGVCLYAERFVEFVVQFH